MKTKVKPVAKCQKAMLGIFISDGYSTCGKPAKALRYFDNPNSVPMHVCGIHARMFRERGYRVEDLK